MRVLQSFIDPRDGTGKLQMQLQHKRTTQATRRHSVSLANEQLYPMFVGVARSSDVGFLLRRIWITLDAGMFAGLSAVADAAARIKREWRAACVAVATTTQQTTASQPCGDDQSSDAAAGSTDCVDFSPARYRSALFAAVRARDYPKALSALHAYYDAGFGVSVEGPSPLDGLYAPLAMGEVAGASGALTLVQASLSAHWAALVHGQ